MTLFDHFPVAKGLFGAADKHIRPSELTTIIKLDLQTLLFRQAARAEDNMAFIPKIYKVA